MTESLFDALRRVSQSRAARWFKRWILWHMPCPIHGTAHTWKGDDPDCSWDAGLITRCSACGNRWTGEIDRTA